MFNAFVSRFGSALKPQLVAVVGCDIQMFNLDLTGATAPQSGTRFPVWSSTWGAINDIHNTHRLRDIALLDGFPYGMASYSTEGWSLFKINTDGTGKVTGFQFVDHYKLPGKPAQELLDVRHQDVDGAWTVTPTSSVAISTRARTAFKIYDMGTGSAAPTLAEKSHPSEPLAVESSSTS